MHNYIRRRAIFRDRLKKSALDSFFTSDDTNIAYLTGFFGNDSYLLSAGRGLNLFVDSRHYEDALRSAKRCDVILFKGGPFESIERVIRKSGSRRIGFESMRTTYGFYERLKENLGSRKLIPVRDLIEDIRAIKEPYEIALINKSIRLARRVMLDVIRRAKPGVSERELAGFIDISFLRNGARSAFYAIVAGGANSSMPHARPSDDRLRRGGVVMIDMGCSLDGYNSDVTRTIFLGKKSGRLGRIYDVVKVAQERAIATIRPGATSSSVDEAARLYIDKNGFGKYFGHALGHGVGMAVHENPTISQRSQGILKEGMVFTVEPAIYLPGQGGVRIEDMVLVTKNGCKILTR